jgi:uncharacterized repeat protein (TIGR03803 family)
MTDHPAAPASHHPPEKESMKRRASLVAALGLLAAAPAFADYSVVAAFPDATGNHLINPGGNPVFLHGKIYMTAIDGGTSHAGAVGSYDPATDTFTTLYSFKASTDGQLPYSGLLQVGDAFYGTTRTGGPTGNGTVWRINTDGTGFQVLHGFTADDGNFTTSGLISQDSVLYGMTGSGTGHGNTLFRLNTDGTNFQTLHTFLSPGSVNFAQITLSGDTLYVPETSYQSSPTPEGPISTLKTDGSSYQALYATSDIKGSQTSMVLVGDTLYGMNTNTSGNGILFSAKTDGSASTILHTFAGGTTDGANPYDSLIAVGDTLYGMTSAGGAANLGTLFSINLDGSNYTLLHSFTGGADGAGPRDGFTLEGNTLYGFTVNGGPNNTGTLFAYTLPAPEPASLALLSIAGAALVLRRRREARPA